NFEQPLTQLVIITSIVSVILTFIVLKQLIPGLSPEELSAARQAGQMVGIADQSLWWKLSVIITCGTAAGAIIPELIKVFTSVDSGHVKEVVTSSKEGGPSLNILSGLTAGNFS